MNGRKVPVELVDLDTGERKRYPSKAKLAEHIGYEPMSIEYYLKHRNGYICGMNKKIEIILK